MNYPESLVRHLMRTVRCSVCEATYEADDVSVLGHQDELWFVAVRCANCQTQGLIAALVRGEARASSAQTLSDRAADARSDHRPFEEPPREERPPHGDPITEADVADMREFLAAYRGDLAALLSPH